MYFKSIISAVHVLFHSLRVFHTSISWWSFTGVKVAASLFKSLGLFWVFLPISSMLWSIWFQFFLWFPFLPVSFSSPSGLFLAYQLLLISSSPSYFTAFSDLCQDPSIFLSFRFLSVSLCGLLELKNPPDDKFFSC